MESQALNQIVAVKILKKSKKKRNLKLDREAYLMHRCECENIIKFYKVGRNIMIIFLKVLETHSHYFIIMEYLDGITLQRYMQKRFEDN